MGSIIAIIDNLSAGPSDFTIKLLQRNKNFVTTCLAVGPDKKKKKLKIGPPSDVKQMEEPTTILMTFRAHIELTIYNLN